MLTLTMPQSTPRTCSDRPRSRTRTRPDPHTYFGLDNYTPPLPAQPTLTPAPHLNRQTLTLARTLAPNDPDSDRPSGRPYPDPQTDSHTHLDPTDPDSDSYPDPWTDSYPDSDPDTPDPNPNAYLDFASDPLSTPRPYHRPRPRTPT